MLGPDDLVPPLSRWIGARDAVDQVQHALSEFRLVALVGPVGAGKTRVAREVARELAGPALRLDITPADTQATIEARLLALPGSDDALLVVDGAESSLPAVTAVLPRWVGSTKSRRALITSRVRPAGLPAATIHITAPLPEDAWELFVQRVRDAGCTDALQAERDTVAQVIHELGRNALAIEGLANRVGTLGRVVPLATAPQRLSLPTPVGTLEAYLAPAWLALPEDVRTAAAALAVFASVISPTDAAAVARTDDAMLEQLVVHGVARPIAQGIVIEPILRDYARVHARDRDAEARHRALLVERIRDGGTTPWQELVEAASSAEDPSVALELWTAAVPAVRYEGSAAEALAQLERLWPLHPTPRHHLARGELARLAGALESSRQHLCAGLEATLAKDTALRASLACALATLCRHSGQTGEARAGYLHLLDDPDTPPATQARALEQLGGLEFESGELDTPSLRAARDAYARMGDEAGLARVEHTLALLAQERGALEAAERAFADAIGRHEDCGAKRFAAIARFDLGALHLECGRIGLARAELQRAHVALLAFGDRRQVALCHALLAVCAHADDDIVGARATLRAASACVDPQDASMRAALAIHDAHVSGAQPPVAVPPSDEARYALRLLEQSRARRERLVVVDLDAGAVEHPTLGRCVVRSEAAQRILATLVAAFEASAQPSTSREDLVRAGWPQSRRMDAAARNRLNVELSRLRKAGLRAQLVREGDGYRLTGPLRLRSADR